MFIFAEDKATLSNLKVPNDHFGNVVGNVVHWKVVSNVKFGSSRVSQK